MKNVQVIDGADNCTYDIFAFTNEEFSEIFSEPGQDIEFIEDVIKRLGQEKAGNILKSVWRRGVKKENVVGIHGTLFYELEYKKKYYQNKRDSDDGNILE